MVLRLISIHALREEGDPPCPLGRGVCCYFYPRPPRGGRPNAQKSLNGIMQFLSTPSARRATRICEDCGVVMEFLSTPSARRATLSTRSTWYLGLFLSTPSARRATPPAHWAGGSVAISIHALREEGDWGHAACLFERLQFLSTPSARRATTGVKYEYTNSKKFLSTPSARRATFCPPFLMRAYSHFYPRPPRGGRQMSAFAHSSLAVFLSTPSARRATNRHQRPRPPARFLSTPSARRATSASCRPGSDPAISIHALREEGDCTVARSYSADNQFLSTPSARRATLAAANAITPVVFLSTPSARRATISLAHNLIPPQISIHALREEGDRLAAPTASRCYLFLSTPSARRATVVAVFKVFQINKFLSTPSARRATEGRKPAHPRSGISIHALREEGD